MLKKFAFIALLFTFSCSTSDEKKEEKSAIVVLSEKIKENPTNVKLLLERVALNKSKNNLESMLFDYKEVIRLDSLNSDFQFNIAEIYFELSKKQNANPQYPSLVKHHLEKSIKINDGNYHSHALMGELMMAYGALNPKSYKLAI
jgi:tetratricopeptide (TPR) repeat protein